MRIMSKTVPEAICMSCMSCKLLKGTAYPLTAYTLMMPSLDKQAELTVVYAPACRIATFDGEGLHVLVCAPERWPTLCGCGHKRQRLVFAHPYLRASYCLYRHAMGVTMEHEF